MGYCHIQISENASNLYTIILPWSKYCYKGLPLGVDNSPENFQRKMEDLFHVFEFIREYIDDFLILIKRYWTYHVHKLELTLNKLKNYVIKCNIEKSFFGQIKMEYLGFCVACNCFKLIDKDIEAITNMSPTTSQK